MRALGLRRRRRTGGWWPRLRAPGASGPGGHDGSIGLRQRHRNVEDTDSVEDVDDTEDMEDTEYMEDTENTEATEDTEGMEVAEDKQEVTFIIL